MKKNLGAAPMMFPQPVLIIATYEENEFKYAFTISDYGVTAVEFDVTEIVNDWFAA